MSAEEREGERQRHAQTAKNSEIVRIMGIARKAGKGEERCWQGAYVEGETVANAPSGL